METANVIMEAGMAGPCAVRNIRVTLPSPGCGGSPESDALPKTPRGLMPGSCVGEESSVAEMCDSGEASVGWGRRHGHL